MSKKSLASELLKTARLGNIQSGLPPILKAAPAIALFGGALVAKATGRANVVEERMLGSAEGVISLGDPGMARSQEGNARFCGEVRREGVMRMCVRCGGLGLSIESESDALELMRRKGLVMRRGNELSSVHGDMARW